MCFKKRAVKKSTATARKKIFIKFLNACFMENQIQLGDVVIAKMPNGIHSTLVYVIAQTDNLTTCLYLNSEREPISVIIPTAWLELPPKNRLKKAGTINII